MYMNTNEISSKAPKNIYLTKNLLGELRDGWDALPSEVFPNIEYTRTDAFIEKAWNWIENNILSSNQQDKSLLYFEKFKNYMKGE